MQDPTGIDALSIPIIYIEVFTLMFISFFIGYFFAFYSQNSKNNPYTGGIEDYPDDLSEDGPFRDRNIAETGQPQQPAANKDFSITVEEKRSRVQDSDYLDLDRLGYGSALRKDDLQRIVGVGPFTEEKLNTIGIYTYGQISRFNEGDIKIVTELIKFFPDRIKNDKWAEQAKMLKKQSNTGKGARSPVLNA